MRARIPAGIDLEDRLLYGLSPARLGYVTAIGVLAIWCWRQPVWLPLRVVPALLLVGAAIAVGWMRRDGRHLDAWAEDVVRYLLRNYRLVLIAPPPRRPRTGKAPEAAAVEEQDLTTVPQVAVFVLANSEPP
ncbi:MAG: hypothetical protein E6J29_08835 [Chloroflexi bacterium]|nr:MAG: hypothetical protein E6J29_08835 [Chloroflexota bacterium]TMD56605.1 MAG: hypothetical protein E6I85_00250 [Chloroflexota bacterium]